jgi:phosphoadenosine phosphosulfate reductase
MPASLDAAVAGLNARFADADAPAMLSALLGGDAGRFAVVSSFGAESAVLLHMVARIDRTAPVIFLDTGRHFAETLAYRDSLAARLGLSDLRAVHPDADGLAAADPDATRAAWDPDGCCAVRKVAPLNRALASFDGWISGRKRFQSALRAAVPLVESDGARLKVNPLAAWTSGDLANYARRNDLPPHPLAALGFASIGCAPCTTVLAAGESPRAGRWRGTAKTECGIHHTRAALALEPSGD